MERSMLVVPLWEIIRSEVIQDRCGEKDMIVEYRQQKFPGRFTGKRRTHAVVEW